MFIEVLIAFFNHLLDMAPLINLNFFHKNIINRKYSFYWLYRTKYIYWNL